LTLRSYVTFVDNQVPLPEEFAGKNPAPGRNVAEALAANLQQAGLQVTHPVTEWEAYGYEFTLAAEGRAVWCMLQASDGWLLITDVHRSWLEKLRDQQFPEAHQSALQTLERVLAASSRWHNPKWYTREEWEHGRTAG
jgi:hypothetical protein